MPPVGYAANFVVTQSLAAVFEQDRLGDIKVMGPRRTIFHISGAYYTKYLLRRSRRRLRVETVRNTRGRVGRTVGEAYYR